MTDYILEIKTVQSNNIKILFEVLKEVLLGDINIIFTPEVIKIMEVDGSETAIVNMTLQSEAFESYYCESKIIVGINTNMFYKIIKIAQKNDVISLFISRGKKSELGIRLENNEDNRVFESKINLLDVPVKILEIPKKEFDSVIDLPSIKFQRYIKNLNSLGLDCILNVSSVGQQIIFSCKGDFSFNKIIIGESEYNTFIGSSDEVIQGNFYLKFLILFTKATSLSSTVRIYIENDFPMILEYSVGSLGKLKFILAPII
jgi:proliferating cell nuclear antigen